jgi:methionine synthase II (cobalamin-independent)
MATYRADHVGSFLRPPALLEARRAHAEGRIAETELRAAEDDAIVTVLDLQRHAGLDVYSDGEYRRGMWITGLPAAVDGFGPGAMLNISRWRGRPLPYVPGQSGTRHPATAGQNPPAVIVGKLSPRRRITGTVRVGVGRGRQRDFVG